MGGCAKLDSGSGIQQISTLGMLAFGAVRIRVRFAVGTGNAKIMPIFGPTLKVALWREHNVRRVWESQPLSTSRVVKRPSFALLGLSAERKPSAPHVYHK